MSISPQIELKIFLNNFPRQEWARALWAGAFYRNRKWETKDIAKVKKNVKMTSFWIKHGSTRPPPRYFFFKSHFEPCHRIVSIDKKLLSTYYLYEKPGIPMERFIVECFRKKVNIFLAFTEFTKIFVPLILFRTISARLFPRRQQCPRWRIQGMNLYHSKLSATWQLFYSLRHWNQTLQHNTQGEHDLGFGRRYHR